MSSQTGPLGAQEDRPASRRGLSRLGMDIGPLRVRPFRRLWLSGIVTALGSQLTAVAVPKQVYELTGSSALIGIGGIIALGPLVVFALWGGAIADAVDRRKLLIVSNLGIVLASALLAVQAALGNHLVGIVFGLVALQQACFGLNRPARSAAIARLLPAPQLPAANALISTALQLGCIGGPLVAGLLIPIIGLPWLYAFDSLGLMVMVAAVWVLPAMAPQRQARPKAGLREIAGGFRYLLPRNVLLVWLVADLVAMISGMPRALYPELAHHDFTSVRTSLALGVLYASIPIGSFAAGLFSSAYVRVGRQGVLGTVAICVWGAAMVGFGLAHSIWLAAAFLGGAGAADMISMVIGGAILQTAADDGMRGRIQGIYTVVVAGGPRLADLLHGLVGQAAGTTTALSGGGLVVIAITVGVVALRPGFWRYRAPAQTALG